MLVVQGGAPILRPNSLLAYGVADGSRHHRCRGNRQRDRRRHRRMRTRRFSPREGFVKGAMTLIDAARAEALYGQMGPGIESSGGSAGNTMAGLASLGGKGAYIGKVRDDTLGDGLSPRHHRDRHPLRHAAGDERAGHRALPDPGDAGRAAHDGHLSRRLRRARAGGHRPRRSSPPRRSPTSKAICSIRRGRRRRSARRPRSPTAPGARWR